MSNNNVKECRLPRMIYEVLSWREGCSIGLILFIKMLLYLVSNDIPQKYMHYFNSGIDFDKANRNCSKT